MTNNIKKNHVFACVEMQVVWCDGSVSRMMKSSEVRVGRSDLVSLSLARFPLVPWLDEQVYSVSDPFLPPPPTAIINKQRAELGKHVNSI